VFRPASTGVNPAIIVGARPRAAFADALRILFPALIAAAAVAAGFALIVAGLLSRTITRPLRELAGTARRFAKGDYRARVPVAGPTEVADMGGAFNDMAAEIERSRGSEQAFLADISHELRTPLTSIQGFAQAIAEGEASGPAIEPQAHEAGVEFVFEPNDVPAVRGDPDRLAQLFLNLLDNAVKHSPRGGA